VVTRQLCDRVTYYLVISCRERSAAHSRVQRHAPSPHRGIALGASPASRSRRLRGSKYKFCRWGPDPLVRSRSAVVGEGGARQILFPVKPRKSVSSFCNGTGFEPTVTGSKYQRPHLRLIRSRR